jgi:hypothetical protein
VAAGSCAPVRPSHHYKDGEAVKRVMLGILRVVESIVTTILGVGCVLAILVAVMFVFLWFILR